jgi:hypothetical protein
MHTFANLSNWLGCFSFVEVVRTRVRVQELTHTIAHTYIHTHAFLKGCFSFVEAVRALRRKKLIEALTAGGEKLEKVCLRMRHVCVLRACVHTILLFATILVTSLDRKLPFDPSFTEDCLGYTHKVCKNLMIDSFCNRASTRTGKLARVITIITAGVWLSASTKTYTRHAYLTHHVRWRS